MSSVVWCWWVRPLRRLSRKNERDREVNEHRALREGLGECPQRGCAAGENSDQNRKEEDHSGNSNPTAAQLHTQSRPSAAGSSTCELRNRWYESFCSLDKNLRFECSFEHAKCLFSMFNYVTTFRVLRESCRLLSYQQSKLRLGMKCYARYFF